MTTLPVTRRATEVRVGDSLPEWRVEATPTFVISTALATRDYQDVHHDRDAALRRGSRDIFINILTTTGLVQRYATDWAGPEALVRKVAIRLGVPCYANDSLTFFGQVLERVTVAGEDRIVLEVVGRVKTGEQITGDHVTGTVHLVLPEGAA